jgi:hypothetical protein
MKSPKPSPERAKKIKDVKAVNKMLGFDNRKITNDRKRLHQEVGKLVQEWALTHEILAKIFQSITGCRPDMAYAT